MFCIALGLIGYGLAGPIGAGCAILAALLLIRWAVGKEAG